MSAYGYLVECERIVDDNARVGSHVEHGALLNLVVAGEKVIHHLIDVFHACIGKIPEMPGVDAKYGYSTASHFLGCAQESAIAANAQRNCGIEVALLVDYLIHHRSHRGVAAQIVVE